MLNYFPHFSVTGYSNSYVVGNYATKEALIVDPFYFDSKLLEKIESNNFYIKSVLITHCPTQFIQGLNTLLKIYDAEVYSGNEQLAGKGFHLVKDGNKIPLLNYEVQVLATTGYSRDSMSYLLENALFTGGILEAGRIGKTENNFLKAQLLEGIQNKILPFQSNYTIFPEHGPITTLDIEKKYNTELT